MKNNNNKILEARKKIKKSCIPSLKELCQKFENIPEVCGKTNQKTKNGH